MSIMALISVLSVVALASLRTQADASATAEGLLTAIRDAQNRAVSVQQTGGTTKAWMVSISKTGQFYRLSPLNLDGTGTTLTVNAPGTAITLPRGTTIKTYFVNGAGVATEDSADRFVFFNAPFGKVSTSKNSCVSSVDCNWMMTAPADEWVLNSASPTTMGFFSSSNADTKERIKFEITYGSNLKINVVVNEKGESYIE